MPRFEVGVFNAKVQSLVQQGERHRNLDDGWAEIRYIEVDATDALDARRKIARRYPEHQDYVIEGVTELD